MRLKEAVASFEADFDAVSEAVGYEVDDAGTVDIERAPCGEPYAPIAASGADAAGEPFALFTDEDAAARAWLAEAWRYAEGQGGRKLYWRERPTFVLAEYVALDQAAALAASGRYRPPVVKLAAVRAIMAVEKVERAKETAGASAPRRRPESDHTR